MAIENRTRLSNIHKDLQKLAGEEAYTELEKSLQKKIIKKPY